MSVNVTVNFKISLKLRLELELEVQYRTDRLRLAVLLYYSSSTKKAYLQQSPGLLSY